VVSNFSVPLSSCSVEAIIEREGHEIPLVHLGSGSSIGGYRVDGSHYYYDPIIAQTVATELNAYASPLGHEPCCRIDRFDPPCARL
jgi:hypothetical protein